MVDEAHATGVLDEKANCADIRMGTFSKALGSFGAYVCGSEELIDFILNKARSFIYTTSLPPSIIAASIAALEIVQNEPQRRKKLLDNADFFRSGLKDAGFNTLDSQTAIIPVLIGEAQQAMEFSARLFQEGIFCQGIRPPTVPLGTSRLRLTVIATHKREDLQYALDKMQYIGKELGVI